MSAALADMIHMNQVPMVYIYTHVVGRSAASPITVSMRRNHVTRMEMEVYIMEIYFHEVVAPHALLMAYFLMR